MENNKNQRKLVRSPEPITICDIPASVIRTVAATVADVMGGGSISPEPAALINEATNTYINQSSSMGNDFSSHTTTTTTTNTSSQNTLTTAAKHNIDSLTRIQNYLFKSIDNPIDTNNPTTNTLKPTCNENNDAGSFDNTAFNDSSDSLYIPQEIEFQKMEMDLDVVENRSSSCSQKPTKYYMKSDDGYLQYSLTSPNNPFLPEIIAEENDVNSYIDWLEENETKCQKMLEDCDKLSPTNSINFGSKGSKSRNNSRGSSSEKLLMMSLSRSCSGEKSDDSLSSKHKRKLFSQNSPQTSNTSRAANPFFCKNSTSSSNDSAPSTASDLVAKREEFLKATMKICLVVSPPVGKLQVTT